MKRICVIGSINIDMVINSPKIPVLGETIIGSGFMTIPGGKGANQAVAAAKLGGNVAMIGCVGGDIYGESLREKLSENNVDISAVSTIKDATTGVAIIVVKDGDNFIIIDQGANGKLTPAIIEEFEGLIKTSFMTVLQLEIPIETAKRAMELSKKNNAIVLLNPAPAQHLSDDLLSMIDIITPNETECEILTGMSIKNTTDAISAVKFLMEKGIPQVIITLGEKGVVYNNGIRIIHKEAMMVKAVDSTAAGDCFTAAVSVAITKGEDIDAAIDFAILAAGITVTRRGAQTSLPTLEEVKQAIQTVS